MPPLASIQPPEMNEAYSKLLFWFLSFPDQEIGLSDLAKSTHISKTTAHTIIERLLKERIIFRKVVGKSWILRCSPQNTHYQSKKLPFHLRMIYEGDILPKIRTMIPHPRSIILFGSYRKGDDIPESDIDIAVEVLGNEPLKIVPLGTLPFFGYRKNVVVNLHIFSRKTIDPNLFANIANGIILEGFLEVRP